MLVATTAAPQAQLQAPKHGVDIVGVQLDANAESDAADCTELLSDRFVPATPSLSTIPQSAAATEARRTVATLIPALVALFLLVACTTNLLVTGLGPGSRFFVNGMSALNHDRRIAYKSAWQQLLPAADTKARLSSSHGLSQPANAAACASLAVLLIGALVHTKLQSWSHSGLSRYSSLPSRGIPATAPDVITPQSCFQRACAALRGGAGAGGGPVWDDIALPMLCGGVIGLAMAAYQTLLGGTIATVWGLAQTVLSPAWSVLLVPASLLSLSALLATQLPQANGVNFVSAVSKHETLSFSRGVVRYARAPSRMLYARLIYMPHLYATSICLIYMPHLYASSICLIYMPHQYASSICLIYMPLHALCAPRDAMAPWLPRGLPRLTSATPSPHILPLLSQVGTTVLTYLLTYLLTYSRRWEPQSSQSSPSRVAAQLVQRVHAFVWVRRWRSPFAAPSRPATRTDTWTRCIRTRRRSSADAPPSRPFLTTRLLAPSL